MVTINRYSNKNRGEEGRREKESSRVASIYICIERERKKEIDNFVHITLCVSIHDIYPLR